MIRILKGRKELGQIDSDKQTIITQSWTLRNFVVKRFKDGVVARLKGWYDEKSKIYIDTAKRLYPKNGKEFWLALQEELILEGYDIK